MSGITDYLSKAKDSASGIFFGKIDFDEDEFLTQTKEIDLILQYGKYDHWIVQDDGKEVITNISKSSEKFTPHVDGISLNPMPRWIFLFSSNTSSINNLKTYLVDTTKFLENISTTELEILKSLDFTFVDKNGDPFTSPLVQLNEDGKQYLHMTGRGYFVPRYSINDEYKPNMETFDYIPVVNKMNEYLCNEKNWEFFETFSQSDLLIFDNKRYLHGRVKLTNERDLSRRLVRIYSK